MIFGLSLGCCYKFINSKNRNDIISIFRNEFDINAIEIAMPDKDFDRFKINKVNHKWLRDLDYVSLHLPNKDFNYAKIHKCIQNNCLGIDNFICHIDKKKDIPYFFNSAFSDKILYENIEIPTLHSFRDTFKICFDLSHGLKIDKKYCSVALKTFKDRIKEIHLSNTQFNICHQTFYDDESNDNLMFIKDKIMPLIKVPIILENSCDSLNELKKEVKFLKENLL